MSSYSSCGCSWYNISFFVHLICSKGLFLKVHWAGRTTLRSSSSCSIWKSNRWRWTSRDTTFQTMIIKMQPWSETLSTKSFLFLRFVFSSSSPTAPTIIQHNEKHLQERCVVPNDTALNFHVFWRLLEVVCVTSCVQYVTHAVIKH